jgi:hypothetical protein
MRDYGRDPIDRVNLAIDDANAWLIAANRRLTKANRLLEELNASEPWPIRRCHRSRRSH